MFNPTLAISEASDVVIASGASITASINLAGRIPVGVVVPATWTAADLTLQTSWDGTTFYDIYDTAAAEFTVTTAAGKMCIIDWPNLIGVGPYLKIRSGTGAAAVNQGAERTLSLIAARSSVR